MSGAYDQARADFEYLESLAELDDQVELDAERLALMREPTKAHAAKLYAVACRLWLQEHGTHHAWNPRVREIEERVL